MAERRQKPVVFRRGTGAVARKTAYEIMGGRIGRLALSRRLGPGDFRPASGDTSSGDRHHHAASDQIEARSAGRSAHLQDAAFDLREYWQSGGKLSDPPGAQI